ncbi:polyprenyl synthetase family protein, partial [bacterium]|nr:polyprenyl synthetase family protein [bacterium]
PSVHAKVLEDYPDWELSNPGMTAEHLGLSKALLVGDAQHAMAMEIMAKAGLSKNLSAELVLFLIIELEGKILPALLTGEVDDVFQTGIPLDQITCDEIILMLQRKTAALLTYSVTAGGLIGIGKPDIQHPFIQSLRVFSDNLGIAFQLRDDILGILGSEEKLGKPIGSDFKEGKRTLAVKIAWKNGSAHEKKIIEKLLGKPDLTNKEIDQLRNLVCDLNGVFSVEKLATEHIQTALSSLEKLPDTKYRSLLRKIAEYTLKRHK